MIIADGDDEKDGDSLLPEDVVLAHIYGHLGEPSKYLEDAGSGAS